MYVEVFYTHGLHFLQKHIFLSHP
uniref:Uncharacterized protein n=1 Tax=Lepeophtheirus salmonis TaxID=72036 RepID=A0A0K2T4K3_LEPSM